MLLLLLLLLLLLTVPFFFSAEYVHGRGTNACAHVWGRTLSGPNCVAIAIAIASMVWLLLLSRMLLVVVVVAAIILIAILASAICCDLGRYRQLG